MKENYKDWNTYRAVLKEINKMIPYKETDYRNGIVAHIFSIGKKDKLTEDWVRIALITDVEDGFITYGQAVTLRPIYEKAIAKLKTMF